MLPIACGWLRDPLLCYVPAYTTLRVNAARFAAEGMGARGDPLLCFPPLPGPRIDAVCLVRWAWASCAKLYRANSPLQCT